MINLVGIWERASQALLIFYHKNLELLRYLYLRFMIYFLLEDFLSILWQLFYYFLAPISHLFL